MAGAKTNNKQEIIVIRLGHRKYLGGTDDLGRTHIGYEPSLTDEQIYEAAKGKWRANATRLWCADKIVVISKEGDGLITIDLTLIRKHDNDALSFEGHIIDSEYNNKVFPTNYRNALRYYKKSELDKVTKDKSDK